MLSLPSLVRAGFSLSLCERLSKGTFCSFGCSKVQGVETLSGSWSVVFLILGNWENRREREEGVDYRLDCWSGE